MANSNFVLILFCQTKIMTRRSTRLYQSDQW